MISEGKVERYRLESFEEAMVEFKHRSMALPDWVFWGRPRDDLGIFSMYYSIMKADSLRAEYESDMNLKFDCVFRIRYDSLVHNEFLIEDHDIKGLNIPVAESDYGGINDRFAFGDSSAMSVYSSAYKNIVNLVERQGYQPEMILLNHLTDNKIVPRRPEFPVST